MFIVYKLLKYVLYVSKITHWIFEKIISMFVILCLSSIICYFHEKHLKNILRHKNKYNFTWFVSILNNNTPADHQSTAWLYGSDNKISGAIQTKKLIIVTNK